MRERKWIIILAVVVAVGLALAYSISRTPLYQATTAVARQTAALDQTLFGTSVFQLQDAQRQLQTGASLVKLTAVAQMVRSDLNSMRSTGALLGMVTVTPSSQTDLMRISAESADPAEAAAVANSFAHQFIEYRREANRSILAAADEKIVAELTSMSPDELKSERGVTLTQKHGELGILESMQTGGFEVVQEATQPGSPVSPRPVRNTAFALIGGLLLGILLAFALDYADRRIKDEPALEREFGLPVLASVPRASRRWARQKSRRHKPPIGFADPQSPFLEAFRTLRSNLRFYQLDKKSQTLLVTSGLPQEGKTVTTINLALSLALSGAKVILLDADLRRPMLHEYLGLSKDVGVSSVLVGTSTFGESLQVVQVPDLVPDPRLNGESPRKGTPLQKRLLCMTSGPLPPNPAELLGTPRMRELVSMATAHAEYVLIDTPPILLVSDALSLGDYADGIIIVSRIKKTTIDEARDTRTMLERSGIRALGIVANGVGRRRGYHRSHYRGYYTPA
jgi:succinoglycan biosynthesis transport protein ExoP